MKIYDVVNNLSTFVEKSCANFKRSDKPLAHLPYAKIT